MPGPLPILQGRRFGCTQCGNCCIEPGYVYMTFEEVRRMAHHLDLRVAEFKEQFDLHWDRNAHQWVIAANDGRGCPLLTSEMRCSVHPVKPAQCRTFPFWEELLDDEAAWDAAKTYCPGMDAENGRLYSVEEIRSIVREEQGT